MLDVEYAQLSTSSSRVVSGLCFASTIPKTEEQRRTHGWLFALADDVEGEKNSHGRKAFVLENICSAFRTASSYELHRALLPRLIQQANAKIVQSSSESKVSIALLACALRSDCAVVCHVGDIRCYIVRRGHAELLTRDHTVANDSRRLGVVPDRETDRSRTRQMLARSLGTQPFVAVDVAERQVIPGDVLLTCSYGFYSGIRDADMELIISDNRDLNVAARELVLAAEKNNVSGENVSVQLLRMGEVDKAHLNNRPAR